MSSSIRHGPNCTPQQISNHSLPHMGLCKGPGADIVAPSSPGLGVPRCSLRLHPNGNYASVNPATVATVAGGHRMRLNDGGAHLSAVGLSAVGWRGSCGLHLVKVFKLCDI